MVRAPDAAAQHAHVRVDVEAPGDPHEAHNKFIFGVNGSSLVSLGRGGSEGLVGAGGFVEYVFAKYFALELGIHGWRLPAAGATELGFDVLAKVPLHVNRWFEPYIGLGPTIVPQIAGVAKELGGGVAVAPGAYFWLAPHVGIGAELNYNIIFASRVSNELGGNLGIVFGL